MRRFCSVRTRELEEYSDRLLGFYPQSVKYDGDFHTLRVTVDRSGLDVRSRAGYYDPADKPKMNIDPDIELRQASNSPLDASAIGLVAAITREGSQFKLAVQIAFRDLLVDNAAPENKDSHWKGAADLAFVSQAADSHTLNLASKALTFDLTADAYQARMRDGIALQQSIPAVAGTARIRVLLVDRLNGAVGSVSLTPPK